jgi:pilus assembly protein CpaB
MNPLRAIVIGLSRLPVPVVLLAVVGLAVAVTCSVISFIQAEQNKVAEIRRQLDDQSKPRTFHAVYAVKDIQEGSVISSEALEERDSQGAPPSGNIQFSSMAVGRLAKYTIPAGTFISIHDLAAIRSTGLEGKLKPGYRAVTLPVDLSSGVAGFVAPGSHVDVLASAGSGHETKTGCILSDVELLAVGSTMQRTGNDTNAANQVSTVTVALTPDDTTKLIKAEVASGKLYLALRGDRDHTPVAVVDVTSLYPRMASQFQAPPNLPPLSATPAIVESDTRQVILPRARNHEVEMFAAGQKQVVAVPAI